MASDPITYDAEVIQESAHRLYRQAASIVRSSATWRSRTRTIILTGTVPVHATSLHQGSGTHRLPVPLHVRLPCRCRNLSSSPIYEYACHEGNYALPGIPAGAREEERAKETKQSAKEIR
jgi:hypothetical protein